MRGCLWLFYFLIPLVFVLGSTPLQAQSDTSSPDTDTFFLLKYKGFLGKLARTITTSDTADGDGAGIQRNDAKFQRYSGRIIRNIQVQRLEFGTLISDTSKKFTNSLIRLANNLHRQTRQYVIRNNLFFIKNDRLVPFLLADNERHLRSLDYLGDARILVRPVRGSRDSVDVFVLTKDVLSFGGSLSISSIDRIEVNVRDDNFFGWGDRIVIKGLYDQDRLKKIGYGMEYTARNIAGSFIDGTLGFQDFYPTLNAARKEEGIVYASFIKPLVHPYMRWTYGLTGGYHSTKNMYLPDSLYESDFRYAYSNMDAWAGFNMRINKTRANLEDERLRSLVSVRYLQQKFQKVPLKYEGEYFFRYADITGILGSLSIFRQDFYKTQYIYGFGRNEDVPEGLDVSVTTGWTKKQDRIRGYAGFNVQLNYFSRHDNYYNYTIRMGGFTKDKKYEDVDLLANLDYFSKLKHFGKWKQRTFITAGLTTQFNTVLNEPLFLYSQFGLPEYRNDSLFGGNFRATVKAESVFYSNWSLFSFRFAPFVFGNASWINGNTPNTIERNFFPSVGGGLRTRNESLVFGTLEFRAYYFPGKNFYNEHFRFEFATNLRFRYNSQLIRRPEFLIVN